MLLTLLRQGFYVAIMWACLTFSLLKMEVCGSKNALPFDLSHYEIAPAFEFCDWEMGI